MIKNIDGIYRDDGNTKLGVLPSIGINSENLEECLKLIENEGVERVFGNPRFGFHEENLDFFKEIPGIKQINFWDVKVKDIKGVYCLKDLEEICIEDRRPAIDFSKLKNLKTIVVHYHKGDLGFLELENAEVFHMWNFKPKEKSFNVFQVPPNIFELEITKANPESLNGMAEIRNLKILDIHYCRNLKSIDKLQEIAPNLEKLVIDKCPRLEVLCQFEKMKSMKFASVNGKTIVKDGLLVG